MVRKGQEGPGHFKESRGRSGLLRCLGHWVVSTGCVCVTQKCRDIYQKKSVQLDK